MDYQAGYVYHIKDEYFAKAQDDMLMQNKEGSNYRPTYYALYDDATSLLWMIPMSAKHEKYKAIYNKQVQKYGRCLTIVLGEYGDVHAAFLLQNMFPVTPYYLDHVHTKNGNPLPVKHSIQQTIQTNIKQIWQIHARGRKIVFTDIDRLQNLMLEELRTKTSNDVTPMPDAGKDFRIAKYVKIRTDDELLNDMKKVFEANSGKLTQKVYREYRKTIDPTIADDTTISKQIGWSNALSLIGVKLSQPQKNTKISEDELLEDILRLWIELGRQPTTTDLKNGLSLYPRRRFNARFGSWDEALSRFIEWVNSEGFISPESSATGLKKRSTSRDINNRLRYKILQRDYFKCCICGASPATNQETKLHVDHITPWAKGGETIIENLQTLCQDCNLGKSDL